MPQGESHFKRGVPLSTQPLEVGCLSKVIDTQPADNGFNGAIDIEHLTCFPEWSQPLAH